MKKSIYIILSVLTIFCLGCRERKDVSHEKPEAIIDTVIYEPTFLSRKLQDSLDVFMDAIDSFPNRNGPVVYTVDCVYNEQRKSIDILLVAEGYILEGLFFLTNYNCNYQEEKYRILGAREVNGRIIAVCSYDVAEPEKLFNLDVLDRNLYYDVYKKNDEATKDAITVRPSVRHYRLIGSDSLKVIRISKSKYEK
ncbi:MAG: hypothetical protein ACI3ZQ_05170 [Candidatus Cryptobacteroides sp.]